MKLLSEKENNELFLFTNTLSYFYKNLFRINAVTFRFNS
jgi:hypothetical protein